MLEINPDLINEMPCNIAVRQFQNKVIVSALLMRTNTHNAAEQDFAHKINQNLEGIIDATVE